MGKLLRRLLYLLHRDRHQRDLDEEMAFHRSHISAPAFGNSTLAREDARAVWIGSWLEGVGQDLRYAARSLRRQPGFAMSALAILGAAIGLNVSLFTVFNALMQRPWPVPDPTRMVSVFDGQMRSGFSLAELTFFANHSRTLDGVAAARCIDGGSDGCRVSLDDRPLRAENRLCGTGVEIAWPRPSSELWCSFWCSVCWPRRWPFARFPRRTTHIGSWSEFVPGRRRERRG